MHETGSAIAAHIFPVRSRMHIFCLIALLSIPLLTPVATYGAAPDQARQDELVKLVRNDCGSCHGLLLNGGLGPALTPQTLKDKPNESLVATILHGRPGTPMPPWQAFLSEEEAAWIVEKLIQGFPNVQAN